MNFFNAELKGPVGQIIHPDKLVLAVEQNKVLMPPTFSRYAAWGFADHSLRIGMYDSDRAMFICDSNRQVQLTSSMCIAKLSNDHHIGNELSGDSLGVGFKAKIDVSEAFIPWPH